MTAPNWNSADYARSSHGQFAWALDTLARQAPPLDSHILNIGRGDGKSRRSSLGGCRQVALSASTSRRI